MILCSPGRRGMQGMTVMTAKCITVLYLNPQMVK